MKIFLFYSLIFLISSCSITNMSEVDDENINSQTNFVKSNKFLIKNINIIPLSGPEEIIYNQDLYIENNTIVEINSNININAVDINIIEGNDKYIIPAFFDMHTHAIEENDFFLYIANGVSTIRHMWGNEELLRVRERQIHFDFIGPRMFLSSPGFEEPPSYWPNTILVEDSKNIPNQISDAKSLGYDFIKIYENLSLNNYLKIVDAANQQNLELVGHLPSNVVLDSVLRRNLQKSIAHVDQYLELIGENGTNIKTPSTYKINYQKLENYAELTAASEVWNCPTLTITTRHSGQAQTLQNNPNLQYVSPRMREWFTYPNASLNNWDAENYTLHKMKLIKALHNAGAKLILGTDTGLRFILPGFSVHEELKYFVDAEISEIESLKIASLNCAEFLNLNQGSIELGKDAELIILDANPRENILNSTKIEGVMTNGIWLSKEYIDIKLEKIKNSY